MVEKVGLVGAGAMGRALLHRLNLIHVQTTAYDISDASMAEAVKMGAAKADTAAGTAAGAEIVHVFVRTDDECIDATLGENGVLAAMAPGTVLILHSTIFPETTQRIGEAAKARGVDVIDAPVTAVPRRVHDGEAVFLMGGDAAVIDKVRPHLAALGKSLYHFGPAGAGNVAKIAKNLWTAIDRVASTETAWLAEAGGLDMPAFFEMMVAEQSTPAFQRWQHAFAIEDGRVTPRPASNLLNKDVGMAAKFANAKGLTARVTQGAAQTAVEWVAGWEKKGTAR